MVLLPLLATLTLGQLSTAQGHVISPPFPSQGSSSQTVNIVNWDANSLPKVYERSDQLPLTDEELKKLSKAGFDKQDLVKMIAERRCACDASADGLISLKRAGVAKEVIQAVSLHGLKPNRSLELLLTLDFTGESREARDNFLYVFVDDGPLVRVMSANLGDLLSRSNAHETTTDKSDILRNFTVRRIELPGSIPLKTYGKHTLVIAASASPTLTHPDQLRPNERASSQTYSIDYPRTSLQSLCRLNAGYKRDAVLTYRWHYNGSRFECEWN